MTAFLLSHPLWVLGYLGLLSLLAFCLMGWDKRQAVLGRWRVRERTLFLVAVFGGSPGAILGMRVFHHKTKHWYFHYGLPALLLLQIALVLWAFWPR